MTHFHHFLNIFITSPAQTLFVFHSTGLMLISMMCGPHPLFFYHTIVRFFLFYTAQTASSSMRLCVDRSCVPPPPPPTQRDEREGIDEPSPPGNVLKFAAMVPRFDPFLFSITFPPVNCLFSSSFEYKVASLALWSPSPPHTKRGGRGSQADCERETVRARAQGVGE